MEQIVRGMLCLFSRDYFYCSSEKMDDKSFSAAAVVLWRDYIFFAVVVVVVAFASTGYRHLKVISCGFSLRRDWRVFDTLVDNVLWSRLSTLVQAVSTLVQALSTVIVTAFTVLQ